MADTMMQLQIMAPGKVEWRPAPVPEPGDGQVLMRVSAVATCAHWDMHLMSGVEMFPGSPLPYPYTPGQPGHEAVGVVAALGQNVSGLSVGTPIAAWRDQGHRVPGCYAQYVCLAAENVLLSPHCGMHTDAAFRALTERCIDNIEAFLSGHPTNVVSG